MKDFTAQLTYAVAQIKRELSSRLPLGTIIAHPDNMAMLKKMCLDRGFAAESCGNRFVESDAAPKFFLQWEFPTDRFIEYEKSDEAWAVPLRFGHWVESSEPAFYFVPFAPRWSDHLVDLGDPAAFDFVRRWEATR